ncbi:MAG: hypothetical protein GYA87_09145 [Christensenellaceae bacterium]|nr:hypothetical protein [Christensenellaceae bacterium]
MIKKILALLIALMLVMPVALMEDYEWMFEGKVRAGKEISLQVPFSGSIKNIFVKENELIKKDTPIFEVEGDICYSPVDGTIGVILAKTGDNLDIIKELLKASIYIDAKDNGTIKCTYLHSSRPYEYRVAQLGETVYIQNRSDVTQTGKGIIVARDKDGYTVKITEGDMRYDSRVFIFRSSTFDAKMRLGSGTIARTDPVAVNAEGTLIKMLCKRGDKVKAGDPLFIYTKSSYDGQDPIVKMPQDGVITKFDKKVNDTAEVNSGIANYIASEEMYVSANLNELEISRIKVGDILTANIESLKIENVECIIDSIAFIPDDKGLYEVKLMSDKIRELRVGTTLLFTVKEPN